MYPECTSVVGSSGVLPFLGGERFTDQATFSYPPISAASDNCSIDEPNYPAYEAATSKSNNPVYMEYPLDLPNRAATLNNTSDQRSVSNPTQTLQQLMQQLESLKAQVGAQLSLSGMFLILFIFSL